MYYKTFGKGDKVVLFLHGWGCDFKTLMPIVNVFKKDYKCICVDFFGHGKSCEMPYPLTVFDFAFAVEKLLLKLNVKEVYIIAHSFGARVGIILASQYKIKVKKMVLFGPAGLKPRFSFKLFFKKIAFKFVKLLSRFGLYNKGKLNEWGSEDYKKLSPTMKKTFSNIINCDLKLFLPLIESKTLIIVGENDLQTPPYMARKMSKKIKNCQIEIAKNCSHFCFLQKNDLIMLAYCFIKC